VAGGKGTISSGYQVELPSTKEEKMLSDNDGPSNRKSEAGKEGVGGKQQLRDLERTKPDLKTARRRIVCTIRGVGAF